MPSASSCLLHVLCFAEHQYQTESKRDKNGRRIILEYLGFSGGRINVKRCPGWPRDRGARPPPWVHPYLVGLLELRRPQLQLYIFRFTNKKTREEVSSRFTIRRRSQALISLGRADLESIRDSGEGGSSPPSSSTILHHQFHDAHRRA